MTDGGAVPDGHRRRPWAVLSRRRAPWTLPLVIIAVIAAVAVVDHLGARRISPVDQTPVTALAPAPGGTAAVHLDEPWAGFNPSTPEGAASSTPVLLDQVLPSAYTFNAKQVAQVNADLLESVEVTSTAPLTIVYTLNPKATWSDGIPVSADDFIYAWMAQRGNGTDVDGKPDRVASTLGYRDIRSVTGTKGGQVVTVVFATPFADWRILFDHMVPSHIGDTVGWNTAFATFNPAVEVAAGPFRLVSVGPDGTAVLQRNPRWWGTPAPLAQLTVTGGPTVAGSGVPGPTVPVPSAHGAIQSGQFGLTDLARITAHPDVQSSLHPSLGLVSLEFAVRSPVTGVPAVRQALAHLIDRAALTTAVLGTLDPSIPVNDDHLAVASQVGYVASSAAGEYQQAEPETAARLLRSAGYVRDGAEPWTGPGGAPLTVRMAVEAGDPWLGEAAYGIVAELAGAGVRVVVTPVDGTPGLRAAQAAAAYDLALVHRTASPFLSVTQGWYAPAPPHAGPADQQDWSGFDDPQVEQLFDKAAQVLNPVTAQAVYSQIDDQLWDQMVALPLFGLPGLVASGVQLSGPTYNATVDGLLWNAGLWSRLAPPKTAARR